MTSPIKPDRAAALSCIRSAQSLAGVMTPAAKWLAVGYLSEAEWKLAGLSIEVMAKVREARHGVEKKGTAPDWDVLIASIETLP